MGNPRDIRDRLEKLEALFARGATPGERAAAGAALERLNAKRDKADDGPREPETEVQYTMPDVWSVRLFVALCRKNGVQPYRYSRQRRTTVMVRVRQRDFERRIVAEFRNLHRELISYFDEMVNHLITDVMRSDGDDETLEMRQIAR